MKEYLKILLLFRNLDSFWKLLIFLHFIFRFGQEYILKI